MRYVLEGSVLRDQNRVRVNAQLIDAASGALLWADRFEEDMADLFKLQDEVVARLATSLGYALTYAEGKKGNRSKNPDAIDLAMQGWALIYGSVQQPWKEMRESVNAARALFDQALKIAPNDADALAGSAATYLRDFTFEFSDAQTDYEAKVLGQASRAIGLAPDNPRPYAIKAHYLAQTSRPSEALGIADAGLAINPNFAPLLGGRIIAELFLGRFAQAKSDAERAMRLSPRDPYIGEYHSDIASAELGLGHFDAAIDEYRRAIDLGLRRIHLYAGLSAAYAQAGKMDEAKAVLAELRRLNPVVTIKWMEERPPNLSAMLDGLRKAGMPEE